MVQVSETTFVVICLTASSEASRDEAGAGYVLATRHVFNTLAEATAYATSIAWQRQAIVVPGDWMHVRREPQC